jgi:hypothetical protein
MKLEEIPVVLIAEFENGYAPMDEPPGFEERYYAAWKAAGGKVKPKTPVTADDL